jgi:hypothetical protein
MAKNGKCPFDITTLNKYLQVWEMMILNEKAAEAVR